jgi:hypothetical protein
MHSMMTPGRLPTRIAILFVCSLSLDVPGRQTAWADPVLYISDSSLSAARAFDAATGTQLFDTQSLLVSMSGLAFGPSGELFAAGDNGSGTGVFRYDAVNNLFSTYVSFDADPAHNVDVPGGMAFNSAGELFVADLGKSEVHAYDSADNSLYALALPGGTSQPTDVAFDAAGNLYTVSSGQISSSAGGVAMLLSLVSAGDDPDLINPTRITVGPDGKLYVLEFTEPAIRVYTTAGASEGDFLLWDDPGDPFQPFDLEFGPDGKLYVAGHNFVDGQVRRYLADGMPDGGFDTGLNFPEFMTFSPIPEVGSAVLVGAIAGLALSAGLVRRAWQAARHNVELSETV